MRVEDNLIDKGLEVFFLQSNDLVNYFCHLELVVVQKRVGPLGTTVVFFETGKKLFSFFSFKVLAIFAFVDFLDDGLITFLHMACVFFRYISLEDLKLFN